MGLLRVVLGAGAAFVGLGAARRAKAEESVCACLEPPDCGTICRFGGKPKGGGSQQCLCLDPPGQDLKAVCYSGSYNDLQTKLNRALSSTDGGDASNATKFGGYTLRLNHNTSDSYVLISDGTNIDKITKYEVNLTKMYIGSKTLSSSANGVTFRATRDDYGRLTGISLG